MKAFLILVLTVSLNLASPQYNYPQPGLISSNFGGSFKNVGQQLITTNSGGTVNNAVLNKESEGSDVKTYSILTKQFYIHSAPHDQDEINEDKVIHLGPKNKHYRVVFIKAPHQDARAGKLKFIAPENEEKTIIYVLSKKTDLADIQADVQQAHSESTKPEVYFIKYKTAEEALHAQKTIQAQYDAIEGTSQVSDEGTTSISSVIGALRNGIHDASISGFSTGSVNNFQGTSSLSNISNKYLPSNY